jgi:hypothetical protein
MRIGDQPEARCDWNGRSHMAPGFLFPLVGAYDRNMVNVIVSGNVRAAPEEVFRFLADLENWPRWQSDMKSTKLAEGQPQPGRRGLSIPLEGDGHDLRLDRPTHPRRRPARNCIRRRVDGHDPPKRPLSRRAGAGGSRVTLNPRPEVRGIGRIMEPLIAFMGRRLNQEHLDALRKELEKG